MRLLLIILFTSCATGQAYVFNGGFPEHDSLVAEAFKQGYSSVRIWNGTVQIGSLSISQAKATGKTLYIKSYSGFATHISDADDALISGMLTVMPTGSNTASRLWNSNAVLPSIVITGAGDTANATAWDVEFHAPDPFGGTASSYANGFIAGQLMAIRDSLNCSWWEARFRARITGHAWTQKSGYGKINTSAALQYGFGVPPNPYANGSPNYPEWFIKSGR
ncbi:MAG TPA: hypothetical protein PK916_08810 [Bacteroidota bacterium]|nr:hypothetical protein [Bacteroidota bacterium]